MYKDGRDYLIIRLGLKVTVNGDNLRLAKYLERILIGIDVGVAMKWNGEVM